MSKPPGDPSEEDPLEPVLREAEDELKRRLRQACEAEATGVPTDSTSEIRRLEDALLAAAVAAEQTVALRHHIERRKSSAGESGTAAGETPGARSGDDEASVYRVREFRDAGGHLWRAWPVTPAPTRQGRTAERYLGEFHKGWICFEALESSARRRLPQQPAHWSELTDAQLVQLLGEAISAPERKSRAAGEKSLPPRFN